jgi:hypothetical protein
MKLASTVLVLGLCVSYASAQDSLTVDVLSGQDASVSSATAGGAKVRVRVVDQDRKPVAGATVSAVLPAIGAGGHFPGGATISTRETDSRGEVDFTGIQLRTVTGDFTTRVLARSGSRTGSATVVQKVPPAPAVTNGWSSRRRALMLGIAGAGVVAGIVAALSGGESSSPTTGLSVTPGIPLTSGPR